jgi:putative ABC transport system substrate-binding protein
VAFLNCAYTLLPKVSIPDDFKGAMEAARARYVEAGILLSSPLAYASLGQVSELALAKRLPLISLFDAFPKNGGLLSYGPNLGEISREAPVTSQKPFKGKSQASCRYNGQRNSIW